MRLQLSGLAALTMTAGGFFLAPATAAETHTVCATGCDFTTIAAAVGAAAPGDTVDVVEDLAVSGSTTINKDVTVTSSTGATITQMGTSAATFRVTGAGATLDNLEITSATVRAGGFVTVTAPGVTLSSNTIYGPAQAGPMAGWTTNRALITGGAADDLLLEGNTFHSLRTGAYLDGSTGLVTGNTIYNTKGDFLVDDSDHQFVDNQPGDPSLPSEWGIVIFTNNPADRYPDVAALGQANGCMTVWDQRDDETYVDSDCDGVVDSEDAFPNDPSETTDSDGDGVGDNADAFPTDPAEWSDSDGDGLGDNADTDTKDDCKGGGWLRFTNPEYKNQGQCVSAHVRR